MMRSVVLLTCLLAVAMAAGYEGKTVAQKEAYTKLKEEKPSTRKAGPTVPYVDDCE